MDLRELIYGAILDGRTRNAKDSAAAKRVLTVLIQEGHVPPDANTRPAGMTAKQCALVDDLARTMLASEGP